MHLQPQHRDQLDFELHGAAIAVCADCELPALSYSCYCKECEDRVAEAELATFYLEQSEDSGWA